MNDLMVKEVVQKYLTVTGMTLRAFADALTCGLSHDGDTGPSHATVINWRDGKTEPPTDLLTLILLRWRDWRFDFALECLATKRPEVWGENGGIWRVARELRRENVALTAELIGERVLTAELTEEIEAAD
jgi:hypothetical protein